MSHSKEDYKLRTCPMCFREIKVLFDTKGRYPKHRQFSGHRGSGRTFYPWCPASSRKVTNNGVTM